MKLAVMTFVFAVLLIGCEEVVEVEEPPGASTAATVTPAAMAPLPSAYFPSLGLATSSEPAESAGLSTEASPAADAGTSAAAEVTRNDPVPAPASQNPRPEVPRSATAAPRAPPAPIASTPVATSAPTPAPRPSNCDPSYPDVCIPIGAADYDCQGGGGNGPNYIAGIIRVLPPDPHKLDSDGDGFGCEPRPSPQ
jgi:hypothetical protein